MPAGLKAARRSGMPLHLINSHHFGDEALRLAGADDHILLNDSLDCPMLGRTVLSPRPRDTQELPSTARQGYCG